MCSADNCRIDSTKWFISSAHCLNRCHSMFLAARKRSESFIWHTFAHCSFFLWFSRFAVRRLEMNLHFNSLNVFERFSSAFILCVCRNELCLTLKVVDKCNFVAGNCKISAPKWKSNVMWNEIGSRRKQFNWIDFSRIFLVDTERAIHTLELQLPFLCIETQNWISHCDTCSTFWSRPDEWNDEKKQGSSVNTHTQTRHRQNAKRNAKEFSAAILFFFFLLKFFIDFALLMQENDERRRSTQEKDQQQ